MADERQLSWYQDLSVIRWIFAIFGILTMLFTGGCSLLLLIDLFQNPGQQYVNVPMVLVIGGIPFLAGLLIWWLAAKVGRKPVHKPGGSDE